MERETESSIVKKKQTRYKCGNKLYMLTKADGLILKFKTALEWEQYILHGDSAERLERVFS